MLVLTRKKDQGIIIGRNIEIVVLAVEGKHVRLGLNAPQEIVIRRKELPSLNKASLSHAAGS
jgi:carbon storage regulator